MVNGGICGIVPLLGVLGLIRISCLDAESHPGASSHRKPWTERGEGYGWKLFHREKRPALERNVIDTS